MASNVEITAQLNKMLVEQNRLYMVQAKIMRGQLAVMQQMAEVMGAIDPTKQTESMRLMNDAIKEADESFKALEENAIGAGAAVARAGQQGTKQFNTMADALDKVGDTLNKISPAALAIDGAIKGFSFSLNGLKFGFNILSSIGSAIFGVAKAILQFPFDLFNALMNLAGQPLDTSYLEGLEEVRRTFGDLSTGTAKAVIDIARAIEGPLKGSGLSAYKVFGNLAERLKFAMETAKSLGPMFNQLAGDVLQNAEAVAQFRKGMGLSDEAMKALGRRAIATKTSISEVQREIGSYAVQVGESLGINARELTQDMNELLADMKRFGGLSAKAMVETAAYARKLGVEIKSLAGIMDTFDNLDTAASAAARLNQQFGIQIDVLKMMKAESPAERVDILRKQFEATGRSIESLDRRSKSYLASQIGISEADADLLFAEKNRGLSLDQIKKKSGEAEKKQLTQVEVLNKLAGSIDRLIKQGPQFTGFFDAFLQGFTKGLQRSPEFRQLMRDIRQIMMDMYRQGRELGRVFIDIFPIFKRVFGLLREIFNPALFKATLTKVIDAFKDFFKTVESDPRAGLKTLWDRLKTIFFDHFRVSSPNGLKLLDEFKKFFKMILTIIREAAVMAIPEVMRMLTSLIKSVAGFLKGTNITNALLGDEDSISGQIVLFFSEIYKAFMEAWPELWAAIKELFSVVWAKIYDWLIENNIITYAMIYMFGPATLNALIGGVVGGFARGISSAIVSTIASQLTTSTATRQITGAIQQLGNKITSVPITATPATTSATQGVRGLSGFINTIAGLKTDDINKAGKNLLRLTLFVSGALFMFAVALAGTILILGGFTAAEVGVTVLALGSAALLIAGIGLIAKAASKLPEAEIIKGGVALGLLAYILGILAITMRSAVAIFKGVTLSQVLVTVAALAAGEVLMLGMTGLLIVSALVGSVLNSQPEILLLVGAGFVVLSGFLVGLAAVMATAIYMFRNLDPRQVDSALKAMLGAELLMTGLAAIIPLIALSGATIVMMAPLVIIGIAAMAGLIYGTSGALATIYQTISALPAVDEGMQAKLDVYAEIIGFVGEFASILTRLMLVNSLGMVFSTFLSLRTPFDSVLSGLSFLRERKSPLDGAREALKDIVPVIGDILKDLNTYARNITPEQLPMLEVLGTVIEAISGLITALQPSTGLTLVGSLIPVNTIVTIKNYFKEIKNVIIGSDGLIAAISEIVMNMSRISKANFNAEAVQAFGSVLNSISSIINAFSELLKPGEPLAEFAERFMTFTGAGSQIIFNRIGSLFGGEARGVSVQDPATKRIGQIVRAIGGILRTLRQQGLFASIQTIIGTIGGTLSGLDSERIKGIGPLAGMISSIFQSIGTFMNSMKIDSSAIEAIANARTQRQSETAARALETLPGNIADSFNTILQSIENKIGPIIESLLSVTSQYTKEQLERAAKGGEMVGNILGAIGTIYKSMQETATVQTKLEGGGNVLTTTNFDASRIEMIIKQIGNLVDSLFARENQNILKKIVDAIVSADVGRMPRNAGEKIKALVDIIGILPQLTSNEFRENLYQLNQAPEGGGPTRLSVRLSHLNLVIKTLAEKTSELFTDRNFILAINNIRNVKNITTKLTSIKTFISDMIPILGDISTTLIPLQTSVIMILSFSNVFELLKVALFGKDSRSGLVGGLNQLARTQDLDQLQQTMTDLSNFVVFLPTAIIPMAASIQLMASYSGIFNQISSVLFGGGDENNPGLFGGVSRIIDELNSVPTLDLTTAVKRVSDAVALGGGGKFTINHRNFTIRIHLTVNLNAETIEEAIVGNPRGSLLISRSEVEDNMVPNGFRNVQPGPNRALSRYRY